MDAQIVAVYCVCADMLDALDHRNDAQCHLTDAEVMTVALVVALFFGGNYALACVFLREHGYMRRMLCQPLQSALTSRQGPLPNPGCHPWRPWENYQYQFGLHH